MKKIIVLIPFLLILSFGIAQNQESDCVSCAKNEISFLNHASGIGTENIATGLNSFIGGNRSSALGDYSFAFGLNAYTEGLSSISIGNNAYSSWMYSIAIGRDTKATGVGATSIGYMNHADGNFSFLFGKYLKSIAGSAITIGIGTPDSLKNGVAHSLMVGFNSNIPTLFVGPSDGSGTTGQVGIGNVTLPDAKLHILGDDGMFDQENASMFIQSASNDYHSYLWLGDTEHGFKAKPNSNLTFFTGPEQDFIFENGKVGIGIPNPVKALDVAGDIRFTGDLYHGNSLFETSPWENDANGIYYTDGNVGIGIAPNDPQIKLDVLGKVRMTDFQLDNSDPGEGKILQSDADGNASWIDPPPTDDGDWVVSGNNIYRANGNVGVGSNNPDAPLHIKVPSDPGDQTDKTYLKIEDALEENGNGTTEIGRLGGNGPIILQKAGSETYGDNGPRLTYKQIPHSETEGLSISTYTTIDGTFKLSDIFAERGNLFVRALDTIVFRAESGTGCIAFATDGNNRRMEINEHGQVGIGTTNHIEDNNFFTKLTVAGGIHAQEVRVNLEAGSGADFVFDNDYDLPGIEEVENFIQSNHHLPGIPSADEMVNNGIDLGEMQINLLQKIEELTLYVIELKKENEEMRGEIENLKGK